VSAPLSEALAVAAQPVEAVTVADLIERQKPAIAKLIGDQAERFTRTVLTEMRRTPKLYECDPHSLLGAMMLSAQLGLEPGPLGHVYLVPFGREVSFIVGYKGMIDLAYRSGEVKDVAAAVVREGDAFTFREGTRPVLDHTPSGPAGDREWTHVYAVARLRSGGTPFRVLYPEDVAKAKARSKAAKKPGSPWDTDTEAMWRKTAVRRLAPFLPVSPLLGRALAIDDRAPRFVEGDVDGELVMDGGDDA
jgi:recombination protein RecT